MLRNLISTEECQRIIQLSKSDERVKVIDYNFSKYSDGYPGFLGDYLRLQIQFLNSNGVAEEQNFFAKSLPLEDLEKRKLLEKDGIFRKEARLYGTLMPKLIKYAGTSKWAPLCYLSRDDLIVLEDLKLIGFRTLPKYMDLSIDHIKCALHSLASFHAANIAYERFELEPRRRTIGAEHADAMFETSYTNDNPWCMTGIRSLKVAALRSKKYGMGSCYEKVIRDGFVERVSKVFELIENPSIAARSVPWVCCHRDLWKNNLMYQFNDEEDDFSSPLGCLLVDYQICRYLPLPLDVIICILLPSRDHSILDECLNCYYEALRDQLHRLEVHIDDVMTFEVFVASCKYFQLFPLMQQGIFTTLTSLPEEYCLDLIKNDEAKYMDICLVNRDELVNEFMDKSEYYRTTLMDSVERLIEFVLEI